MGLRTGPIQEGSQPGPRLGRKARAGKAPTAQGGFKRNQACTSFSTVLKTSKGTKPVDVLYCTKDETRTGL
eukprot:scaffold27152_cov65-Phaeocystis_antarctica.AAC.3